MRSVAVLGIGETRIGKHPDRSLKDLIKEAGDKAIADAGIERSLIQALYIGNFNGSFFCGQSHINALAAESLGLGGIPALRTEGACASGSIAFRQAYVGVATGMYDFVLVGGVEKMTHRDTETVTLGIAGASDFQSEVNLGTTFPSIFAMIANRYFYEYGNQREAMAVCAVQNHQNALLNPDAQLHKQIRSEDVWNAPRVADPLTLLDCSLVSDGACFVVLAAADEARHFTSKRIVEVAGSGHAGDTLTLAAKREMTTLQATVRAANEAYKSAGLAAQDVHLAEVHDCFTITQLLNLEDLGFFPKGEGGRAILQGKTAMNDKITINSSGGLKAKGHPIGATGLSQIYEIVTQLRGEAGERQVNRADIGLTHSLGGAASTCVVHIFRGR